MDGLTTQIAEFAAQLQYGDLPEEVIQTARVRIVDAIGCALGGSASPTLAAAGQLAVPVAAGGGALTGWQLGRAEADLPVDLAAFLNTAMIRYLDFNDWFPGGHPSDTVGGLIALAGAGGATGRRLITATVVSYEVFARITAATDFRKRGYDQGFAMGVATAAAIGNLLSLDAAAIGAAVGIIAASGVPIRATRSGQLSMWKGCATAYAVRNAAFAIQLAAAGMTGPPARNPGGAAGCRIDRRSAGGGGVPPRSSGPRASVRSRDWRGRFPGFSGLRPLPHPSPVCPWKHQRGYSPCSWFWGWSWSWRSCKACSAVAMSPSRSRSRFLATSTARSIWARRSSSCLFSSGSRSGSTSCCAASAISICGALSSALSMHGGGPDGSQGICEQWHKSKGDER